MPKLKLELGQTYELALKYAKGKFYESTIPGLEGSLMYSLTSGDVIFLPESADEMFANAYIGAQESFSICRRKTKQKGEFYEVHKLSDAAEPDLDPTRYPDQNGDVAPRSTPAESKIERDLAESLRQAQQRKGTLSKVSPSAAATTRTAGVLPSAPHSNNPIAMVPAPAQGTRASNVMAGALCAAVDAALIARDYAAAKGLVVTLDFEALQKLAATMYIQACKDPLFTERAAAGASGGAAWRQ